jgi:MFS family permease
MKAKDADEVEIDLFIEDGSATKRGGVQDDELTVAMFALIVLLPSFLQKIAESISYPVLPVFAKIELHSSDAALGAVVAISGLGKMASGVPSGVFVQKHGPRNGLILATAIMGVAWLMEGMVPSVGWLCVARLIEGLGLALFQVGRQVFVTATVSKARRGRVMSTLGGISRISSIFGPLMGGKLSHGSLRTPFYAQSAIIAVDVLVLFLVMPRPTPIVKTPGSPGAKSSWAVFQEHSGIFKRVAFFVFCMMVGRESRNLLFPLKALQLGMDADQIGQMTAASYLLESCMFPFAGILMDTYGRKYAGTVY